MASLKGVAKLATRSACTAASERSRFSTRRSITRSAAGSNTTCSNGCGQANSKPAFWIRSRAPKCSTTARFCGSIWRTLENAQANAANTVTAYSAMNVRRPA